MIKTHASPLHGGVFDHIGLVVKTLDRGRSHMRQAFGIKQWTVPLTDPVNGVHILFGRDPAGVVYELLAPIDANSPVHGALAAKRNLLNHVAYRVANLDLARDAMRLAGCAPTAKPKPAIAFGGQDIQFFVTPLNIIVELIEALDHQHMFQSDEDESCKPTVSFLPTVL